VRLSLVDEYRDKADRHIPCFTRYLDKHPEVAWVSYLGLESHASHGLAKKLIRKNAYGGVLSFGVKGDAKKASQVVDNLRLASNLANVGEFYPVCYL